MTLSPCLKTVIRSQKNGMREKTGNKRLQPVKNVG
jgi:hypothetical protein